MSAAWMVPRGPSELRTVLEALLAMMLLAAIALSSRSRGRDAHRRGARIRDGRAAQRRTASRQALRREPLLTLAGVGIRPEEEAKHFKLIGTTGTGKSTAIRELLAGALERGDRAVITDPHGDYLERFHDAGRGDVILNPFDARSLRWDPFAEVREPYDAEQLASSLIPSTEDASGREWRGYARTFLTAIVRRCHEAGRHDAAALWRLIAMAPSAELRPLVAGTPAQPFLEPENARMFGSIRSVAGSAAAALEHVQSQRSRAFSVRDWIEEGRGALFLPYEASQIAALRTIIATWVRLAIFQIMSGKSRESRESRGQRLWLIVDELDALGAIDGLKDALARLRKFGGRCVLGFQSIAQVSSTYGAGEAQTLIENCGNTLILRCSASEHGGTSQFASRLIGEREVARRSTSRGRDGNGFPGARGWRRSMNVSEQRVTEAAVLASELEQLPDLTGYLKTASSAAWLRVRLPRV
ncbi:MAG TPA: type IV secretion system DNA-binding domain-containing protein [Steroidobacteraceae bacterium]|nr:type IV secretion system DNA-binding domain-containing protein [Steroidobacteraceae bacterium]